MPTSSRVWLPRSLRTASLIAAELHRAGEAVDQRDAVEEEAGGEGAEQEVLERRLLAQQPPATGQPAEQVEREREHLERHEHREQVVGRGEQHHAEDREHHQREDLGVVEAGRRGLPLRLGAGQRGRLAGEGRDPALEPALGEEQHAAEREDQDDAPQEDGRAVQGERALHRQVAAGHAVTERGEVAADHDGADQGGQQRDHGQHGLGEVAGGAREEGLQHDPEARGAEDEEQRPELGVLDGGLGELHQLPSSPVVGTVGSSGDTPTSASVESTVGLITSSSGIG